MKRAPLETRRHFARRVEARQEFLADILICAVEGGINHWATVLSYEYKTPSETHVVIVESEPDEPVSIEKLRAYMRGELGEAQVGAYPIDTGRIETAIARIIGYEAKCRLDLRATLDWASKNTEAGDVDAEIADVVMQVACFGEIVYG